MQRVNNILGFDLPVNLVSRNVTIIFVSDSRGLIASLNLKLQLDTML